MWGFYKLTLHDDAASGNGAITLAFHFAHLRRAVPEQIR
jgi:hypothetical protein